MKTPKQSLIVNDIEVQVARKAIKNLYLSVSRADGCVRVSVPRHVTDETIHSLVLSRRSWIEEQQARVAVQARQSQQQMITGESHSLWGKDYLLEIVERRGRHEVVIRDHTTLSLYVNPDTSAQNRKRVFNEWYRDQLKQRIPPLIHKWQPIIGRQVADWGVKKMKTRWGTCNISQRRIWLNLELAKKPRECLEFVVVHEMVHLLERYHNARFYAHMDRLLPDWRHCIQGLNRDPLAHGNCL
jgi:predicted metal-dependent hydrolase